MLWIGAIVLGSFSAFLIFGEYVALIAAKRAGRRFSLIPLIPGLIGAAACWICPVQREHAFFWVPLLLDLSYIAFLCLPVFLIVLRYRRNRPE